MTDDPLAMYYVVRKDVPLSLGRSMALAGAAAVLCADELAGDERFAGAFAVWERRARKVALRATAEEIEDLRAQLPGAFLEPGVLCLPPMRKSERPELLAALSPFTDARRPKEPPPEPPAAESLVYVIRPGVIRTAGKAMAQAGHAATMAANTFDLKAWRTAGMPGIVRGAGDADWDRLRGASGAVVVEDAGLTQVEAGTETVIAVAPGAAAAERLEPVP